MSTERFLAAIAALLIFAAPAGADWTAPATLADGYGYPKLAFGPDGEALATWTPDANVVAAYDRAPGGAWTAVPAFTGPSDTEVYSSVVAVAPDHTARIAWVNGYSGTPGSVRVATRPPGGTFGSPETISGSDVVLNNWVPVTMVTGPDGTTAASWIAQGDSYAQLVRVAVAPPGGSFGAPVTVSRLDRAAGQQALGIAADGTVTVTWLDNLERPDGTVESATRAPDGTWGAPDQIGTDANPDALSFAELPSGAAVASWVNGPDIFGNGPFQAHIARRAADGTWGPETTFSTSSDWSVLSSAGPGGHTATAWIQRDDPHQTLAAMRGQAGDPSSPLTPATMDDRTPNTWTGLMNVALDARGDLLIAWTLSGMNSRSLYVTPWPAGTDAPLPTEHIADDLTEADPALGMDASGRAILIWGTDSPTPHTEVAESDPFPAPPAPPSPPPADTPAPQPDPPASGATTPPVTSDPPATPTVTPTDSTPAPAPAAATCRVPDLRGKTEAAARRALARAHCRAGKVRLVATRLRPWRGRVLRHAPAAGAVLPAGTKVALTVGRVRRVRS